MKTKTTLLNKFTSPLTHAIEASFDSLAFHSVGEKEHSQAIDSVIILAAELLKQSKKSRLSQIKAVRSYIHESFGDEALQKFSQEITREHKLNWEETCIPLLKFPAQDRNNLLKAFMQIAYFDEEFREEEAYFITLLAKNLKISKHKRAAIKAEIIERQDTKQKRALSLAGFLAILLVSILFILTAMYLKSVLIGVALAYFFLPLQQFYLKKFMGNNTIQRIMELKPQRRSLHDCKLLEKRANKKMNLACNLTIFTVFFAFILVITLFTTASYTVLKDTQKKIVHIKQERLDHHFTQEEKAGSIEEKTPTTNTKAINDNTNSPLINEHVDSPVIEDQGLSESYVNWIRKEVSELQDKLQDFPVLSAGITQLSLFLEDKNNFNAIAAKITKASGGLLGTLQVMAGTFVNIVLDLFMGFFFFIFFLKKMALFQLVSGGQSTGQYLIEGIFNSTWTPSLKQSTKQEAMDILDVIIEKMQRWVKGCMFIILIELPIFLIVFSLMGVPFAIPLAIISSLQVLLPFLGPIIAMTLTLGTCLFNGITDPAFYLGLMFVYFLIVTLLEGFFLYPKLVGASLGLTLLETIIVVLLGGIFAGIGGAIFGVPAASIIKYLSPRIYRSFFANKETPLDEDEDHDDLQNTTEPEQLA
ncbi:AI-2E family transporter [Lentisphaera profundi]|uniref:AI-2E family transporter n=1 Tax=Lentisphaera profundi TaxID=1658616 RepID=A0ABY7VND8_9BACT|nr:AI-2E family transporter [Lentisphaera profundi]WDE95630.1 AI-2E family transporter [Lentisphaera profundi]